MYRRCRNLGEAALVPAARMRNGRRRSLRSTLADCPAAFGHRIARRQKGIRRFMPKSSRTNMSEGECGPDRAPPESLRRALDRARKRIYQSGCPEGSRRRTSSPLPRTFVATIRSPLHDGNWKSLCCDGIPFLRRGPRLCLRKPEGRRANQIRSAASLDSDVDNPAGGRPVQGRSRVRKAGFRVRTLRSQW